MKFRGIFTALATPFDEKGEVNYSALKSLVERNIQMGVSGLFVCGSSAEAFLMSVDERKRVLKAVAQYNNGRLALIAHIGAIATRDALDMLNVAEESGYDAVASVAPFYHRFTLDEIKDYFFTLADSSSLPLLIYNIPTLTGVTFTFDQMSELLSHNNIAGFKHTSSDYYLLRRLKTAFPEKLAFNGYDETLLAGLCLGADGAIGSTFNFMGDTYVKIFNLFESGSIAEAMALQEKATKTMDVVLKYGLSQSIKAILKAQGIDCGNCRPPFDAISPEKEHALLDEIIPLLAE